MTDAAPVAVHERIVTLDIVRGVALLGIFIMNMPWFGHSFYAETSGSYHWPQWWDRWVQAGSEILFSGKFNSMFSMLFGIGFTIQLTRLQARHGNVSHALYARRLAALFLFGLIHACVFWTGDVLHMYALLGVLLLALRNASDRAVLGLIALCLLYPLVAGVFQKLHHNDQHIAQLGSDSRLWEESNNLAYGAGTFYDAMREHTREAVFLYTDRFNLMFVAGFYVQLASTMLLGLLAGRQRWLQESERYLPAIKRAQWWSLAVGAVSGAVFGVIRARVEPWEMTWSNVANGQLYVICRIALMLFYVASIVRLAQLQVWRRRFGWFAATGRMPLSNYLLQTLLATSIFYGWGLGYWGVAGPAVCLLLAVGIYFLVQVPLSIIWLKYFRYGPMEYVWRVLTYGSKALRNERTANDS
jgi:uncharacterized protein